jgi:hypothetical protein
VLSPDYNSDGYVIIAGLNMAVPDTLEILLPWQRISDSPNRVEGLSAELSSELSPEHVLFGLKASAVANRIDRDDILFEIDGGNAPLAEVHLSWQRKSDPRWPTTRLFSSWDAGSKTRCCQRMTNTLTQDSE